MNLVKNNLIEKGKFTNCHSIKILNKLWRKYLLWSLNFTWKRTTLSAFKGHNSCKTCNLYTGNQNLKCANGLIWFIVFNTTFSNISAISWWPVLVVEEAGVPGVDHGQATGKLYHLRLQVECTLFCNLRSRARTHAVLLIGLYELLGNPTT